MKFIHEDFLLQTKPSRQLFHQFAEAEPILRQGIAVNTALLEGNPADDEVRFDLGNCRYNLGYLQFKREQYDEALGNLDQARQLEEAAPEGESSPQPRYRRMLAMIQRYRGEVLDAQDKPEALEAYRAGADILATLTAKFPENIWYEVEYAQCLNRLADKLVRLDRADEAEGDYKRALAALEPKPGTELPRQAQLERAMTLNNYGLTRHNARPGEGEDLLHQSIALASKLASSTPAALTDRQFLAVARNNLGEVFKETGRYLRPRGEETLEVIQLERNLS